MKKTLYTDLIAKMAPTYNPNEVEAFLRLQFGTLDHLDRATFHREIKLAAMCIDADPHGARVLALSYGL